MNINDILNKINNDLKRLNKDIHLGIITRKDLNEYKCALYSTGAFIFKGIHIDPKYIGTVNEMIANNKEPIYISIKDNYYDSLTDISNLKNTLKNLNLYDQLLTSTQNDLDKIN